MQYSKTLKLQIEMGWFQKEIGDNILIYNNSTDETMDWMKEWLHVSNIYAPGQSFGIPREIAELHNVSVRWLITTILMRTQENSAGKSIFVVSICTIPL